MDMSSIAGTVAMAAIVRQLQTANALQTVVMAQIADSQQQMAVLLAELGVGQQIDIMA